MVFSYIILGNRGYHVLIHSNYYVIEKLFESHLGLNVFPRYFEIPNDDYRGTLPICLPLPLEEVYNDTKVDYSNRIAPKLGKSQLDLLWKSHVAVEISLSRNSLTVSHIVLHCHKPDIVLPTFSSQGETTLIVVGGTIDNNRNT